MKTLLIDVDSHNMPNLALMKISSYHKSLGDQVFLNHCSSPDLVYISCIYEENRSYALGLSKMYEAMGCKVKVGGYGVNGVQLSDEVEHQTPDYSLYNIDYSMGYSSRGCLRKCPWCLIWRYEGKIRDHAPLKEFLRHRKLILLDGNFLASPKALETLKQLYAYKIKVCFTQGLDIRLIDQENARLLSKIHYRNHNFTGKQLYFSWDLLEMEDEVRRGIEVLKKVGIPPSDLMFYFLCGYGVKPKDYTYDYFMEHDMYRFKVLRELGVLPFCMVYNDRRDIPLLRRFRRWASRPRLYKSVPWEKYRPGYSWKSWKK